MAHPNTFMAEFTNTINQFIKLVQVLETQSDLIERDPETVTKYFSQTPIGQEGSKLPRFDITEKDVKAASAAVKQILKTYDEVKPKLYRILP